MLLFGESPVTDDKAVYVYIYIIRFNVRQMTFDPELIRMLTSVMATLILEMVKALISAVHLSGALWKQIRMYKVSFRCVTYVIGKPWQFCQLDFLMASKTTRLPQFFRAWRVYGVYGQSCQAILCYKVYSGVAIRYILCWGGGGGDVMGVKICWIKMGPLVR